MELASIYLILNLSRADLVLKVAELSLTEFNLGSSSVLVVARGDKSTDVLTVNGDASFLGERFAVKVLRVDLGDVT